MDAAPGRADEGWISAAPGEGEHANWRSLGVALLLVAVAFAPTLLRTVQVWWRNPEYSHGFLMPLVSAYLHWGARERLALLRGGTSVLAPPLLLLGLLGGLMAELNFLVSLAPYAFVLTLASTLLAFLGWRGLLAFVPALVPLLLACPLPAPVHERLTLPLKEVSAGLAVGLLDLSGIPAFLDGNMLHLEGVDSLWVADACSGIRSLISLVSLALIGCLVWERPWILKAIVVVAAVPIAIAVNGLRIWLTAWLSVKVSPESAEGVYHFFEGFALFAVAGLLLWGFASLLSYLFARPA